MALRGISRRMESLFASNNVNYSKSDARAAKAQDWIEKEISKLVEVIGQVGHRQGNGQVTVTFGELFHAYQDISDTLVGIMVRARKRNLVHYDGHMLFQGTHDHVVITLLNGLPPPSSGAMSSVRNSVRTMFGFGRSRAPPPAAAAPSGVVDMSKYTKMLKAGLSREAVQHKMNLDGVDPDSLPNGPAQDSYGGGYDQQDPYGGGYDQQDQYAAAPQSSSYGGGGSSYGNSSFGGGGGSSMNPGASRKSRVSTRRGRTPRDTQRHAPSKSPIASMPPPARPRPPAASPAGVSPGGFNTAPATTPKGPRHFAGNRVSRQVFSGIAALIQMRKAQKGDSAPAQTPSNNYGSSYNKPSPASTLRKASATSGAGRSAPKPYSPYNSHATTKSQKPPRPDRPNPNRKSNKPAHSTGAKPSYNNTLAPRNVPKIDVPRQSRRPQQPSYRTRNYGDRRHGVKSIAKRFGGNATPSPVGNSRPSPASNARAPVRSNRPQGRNAPSTRQVSTRTERHKSRYPTTPVADVRSRFEQGQRGGESAQIQASRRSQRSRRPVAPVPSRRSVKPSNRKSHFPGAGTIKNLKSMLTAQAGFGISQPSYDAVPQSSFSGAGARDDGRGGFVPAPSFELPGSPITGAKSAGGGDAAWEQEAWDSQGNYYNEQGGGDNYDEWGGGNNESGWGDGNDQSGWGDEAGWDAGNDQSNWDGGDEWGDAQGGWGGDEGDWNDGGGASYGGESDWNGDGTGGDGWGQNGESMDYSRSSSKKGGGFMGRFTMGGASRASSRKQSSGGGGFFSRISNLGGGGSFSSKTSRGGAGLGTLPEDSNADYGGYDGGYDQGDGGYEAEYDQGAGSGGGGGGGGSSDPIYDKYYTMVKIGLPRGAVEQAMARDDVDPSGFQW